MVLEAPWSQFHVLPASVEDMANMLPWTLLLRPEVFMVAIISGCVALPAKVMVCTNLPVDVPPSEVTLLGR